VRGPLEGVKIVDLSVAIAGPWAVGMLADQGADVVKVEQPGMGDIARYVGVSHGGVSAMFQLANRGKRSIALNLSDPRGVDVLRNICRDADVFVQNFRPGVADRMGIGERHIRGLVPDIVYVSITGFGSEGPHATKRVYDNVVQAQSGLMHAQAGADGVPQFIRQLAADKITSITAAQAITAALFARERGAEGQHVTLSMLDAVVAFLWLDCAGNETLLDNTQGLPSGAASASTVMRFLDGFGTATPLADSEFHGLARAFGVDSTMPEVATVHARMANRSSVADVLREVYARATTMTTAEAMARMEAEDVPCGRAVAVADLADDEQVQANGLLCESVEPHIGRVRQTRPPARFDRTPAVPGTRCPLLGEHTDELLRETGMGDRIGELRDSGVIA
jgi:crotonobetainyl-CoA:carnitine CoA-transferase CaiB-like acyl-CoA transferase